MLNPPLANLSNELLALIVEHIIDDDNDPTSKALKRLSVADRTFTLLCQSHLFKELTLFGSKPEMTRTLKKAYAILKRKESSPISFVRKVRLDLDEQTHPSWLFENRTFCSLMEILSKAPRPPYELEIMDWNSFTTESSELIVEGLANLFFSRSLESLLIWRSQIPASILVLSPALKRLELFYVKFITSKEDVEGEGAQFIDRRLPRLRSLDHRLSFNIVQQMLPGEGIRKVADLSQLRVLHMCPEDKQSMALAQPILEVAQETLEEIQLTHSYVVPDINADDEKGEHLPLAELLDLQKLHQLRLFVLRSSIYGFHPNRLDVMQDITKMLGTIPSANSISSISIRIQVFANGPFRVVKPQKWKAFAREILRISSGKSLRFELDMDIQDAERDPLHHDPLNEGQVKELYDHIETEMRALRTAKGVEFDFQNEVTRSADEDDESDGDTYSDSDIY